MEEASRLDYEALLDTIDDALAEVENTGAYDQLTLYNGIVMLLYDQRVNLKSTNVDKSRILMLMDTVYEKTNNLSVNKEQSKNLKEEILNCYQEYSDAIDRTYANAEIITELTKTEE